MDEKRDWPSEEKLSRLRASGVTPRSESLGKIAGLFGGILGVVAIAPSFFELTLVPWKVGLEDPSSVGQQWFSVVEGALKLIVAFLACYVAGVFIAGFAQTKFLFRMGLLSFDVARSPELLERGILSLLVSSLWTVMTALGIGATMYWLFSTDLFKAFTLDPTDGVEVPYHLSVAVGPGVLVAILSFGLALFFYQRFWFRWRHRMTKREIEAEER